MPKKGLNEEYSSEIDLTLVIKEVENKQCYTYLEVDQMQGIRVLLKIQIDSHNNVLAKTI